MKIITWNVRAGNRKLSRLLAFVMQHRPDVVCLQEVPRHALHFLHAMTNFNLSYTCDLKSAQSRNDRLTCILTVLPIRSVHTLSYGVPTRPSLWDKIVYQFINRFHECHTALVVELVSQNKPIRIISTRLSAVVRTKERIRQADAIFHHLDKHAINIICGDLNIVDSNIVNIISGWARGFKLPDYLSSERTMFETVCAHYNLINIFRGISTWMTKIPRLQYDHILIPKGIAVVTHTISKKLFGSDHHMLLAELNI